MSSTSPLPHDDDPVAPAASASPRPALSNLDTDTGYHLPQSPLAPPHHDQDEDPSLDPPDYIEPPPDELLPPPGFGPFFTLIEDLTTGEHYHPDVHYIFASDDQEIITAASIRSLGGDDTKRVRQPPQPAHIPPFPHHDHDHNHDHDHDPSLPPPASADPAAAAETEIVVSSLPPARPGVAERYIMLDVAADGHTVADWQSLSREWQVTRTTVRAAPMWDAEEDEGGGVGAAMMLMVEGVKVPVPVGGSRGVAGVGGGTGTGHAAATPVTTTTQDGRSNRINGGEKLFSDERRAAGGDSIAGLEALVQRLEKEADIAARVLSVEEKESAAAATAATVVGVGVAADDEKRSESAGAATATATTTAAAAVAAV